MPTPSHANFASMKAAAHGLGIDIAVLREARSKACPAFRDSGGVNRKQLIEWLKNNSQQENTPEATDPENFEENYDIPDEAGGVGQTLKSLQAYERRLKQRLDKLERATNLHPSVKSELLEKAQNGWIKVVNALLKYDLSVSQAKRESGELIPMSDAVKAVQALLAWHTVATSDALRNVIPRLEKKTKYEIAAILDPALRSSIYRNFKLGVKLGKIPEWMGKSASDFIKGEAPISLEKQPASTNLDDY